MSLETGKQVTLAVSFGPARTGLSTVGYALFNGDGSTFQARTTTDVTETNAPGSYIVQLANTVFTDEFDGWVEWDTGELAAVYAVEDIHVYATQASLDDLQTDLDAVKAQTDRIPRIRVTP